MARAPALALTRACRRGIAPDSLAPDRSSARAALCLFLCPRLPRVVCTPACRKVTRRLPYLARRNHAMAANGEVSIRRTEAKAYFGAWHSWQAATVARPCGFGQPFPAQRTARAQHRLTIPAHACLARDRAGAGRGLARGPPPGDARPPGARSRTAVRCGASHACRPPCRAAANERTFLHWMNMSVTIGSIAAALSGAPCAPCLLRGAAAAARGMPRAGIACCGRRPAAGVLVPDHPACGCRTTPHHPHCTALQAWPATPTGTGAATTRPARWWCASCPWPCSRWPSSWPSGPATTSTTGPTC